MFNEPGEPIGEGQSVNDEIMMFTENQRAMRQSIIDAIDSGGDIDLLKARQTLLTKDEDDFWVSYNYRLHGEGVDPEETPRYIGISTKLGLFRTEQELKGEVQRRIDAQRDFAPTADNPNPASLTGEEIDDAAAVIAGRKKLAIISGVNKSQEQLREVVFNEAQKKGLTVKEQKLKDKDYSDYLIGSGEDVDRAYQYLERYKDKSPKELAGDEEYHRALGKMLGYPNEAIERFIKRNRDE